MNIEFTSGQYFADINGTDLVNTDHFIEVEIPNIKLHS